MDLLDRSYATVLLDDATAGSDAWLAQRPTLGIGLSGPSAARCSLGNIDPDPRRLDVLLPRLRGIPRGARIVVARADLPTLGLVAGIEARSMGAAPGPGWEALTRSLRRSDHPCRMLAGADPAAYADDDPVLVLAALCRTVDLPGTPLRHRVDVCREFLQRLDFTGRRTAVQRIRRWLTARADGTSASGRPSALMSRIAGDGPLHRAWERVRDNAAAAASPPREAMAFEADLTRNLQRLQRALLRGAWRPGIPRTVRIPKPDGGRRTLHIPPVGDRVVERAVASVLAEEVDERLSPWSFAFRPGRGVTDAIRALAGLRDDGATHVARFDLADAFGSVDHARLMDAFDRFVDDAWTRALVARIVARELPGIDRSERLVGIAQGSPLSPLLCNILLDDLDRALVRHGTPAVRYADDLALAAPGAAEAAEALRLAEDLCDGLGFRINDAKCEVRSFADVVEFLGEAIGPDSPPSDPGADEPPPRRRTLYLTSRTTNVHLRAGQVRSIGRDGGLVSSVPVSGVGRVVVMGPTGVSAGLRAHAMRNDVDVVFLSRSGSWLGRYDSGRDRDVRLRIAQYRLVDDEPARLAIAQRFVHGKIANQRALLQRYVRRDRAATLSLAVDELGRALEAVDSADSRNALMGVEGVAARSYLAEFGRLLPPEAGFSGRNRRPPLDPGNAVLSFGYTLLTGEAHAACEAAGLDASVGILHDVARRRPSLALDLVEEFRPLIVDSVALTLFRRRRLRAEQFRSGEGDAVLLNDAGRRVLIDAYETRMLTRVHAPARGQRITYREALHDQARQLAEVVAGDRPRYSALSWR